MIEFQECRYLRNCILASHIMIDDCRITIGYAIHGANSFLVLCVQDFAGCQHITMQTPEALALIEKICHVMLVAGEG